MRFGPFLLSMVLAAGAALAQDAGPARHRGRFASPPVNVPPGSVPLISPMTAVPPMQVRPLPPMTTVPPMPVRPLPPTTPVVPLQQIAPPPVLTSCDAGGCWSSDGTRLNRAGQNLVGPGGVCTTTGQMVHCP